MITQNLAAVPDELKNVKRWILWVSELRDDDKPDAKPTKVPYAVHGGKASATDSTTWVTFAEAKKVYNPALHDGLGLIISPPYVGIDLDNCRNPDTGDVEQWAKDAVEELNSYTELSPSGKGFHIWVQGWIPDKGRKGDNVEIYRQDRYLTVTGQHVANTPNIINKRDLGEFFEKHFGNDNATPSEAKDTSDSAKEFRIACDIWKRLGRNATIEDVRLEFFCVGTHRKKWEKHRDYVDRTIKKARKKVFGIISSNADELIQTPFSNIEAKSVTWLWENRIPKGKLVMFSGNPDCGKTTVLCDLISHYTTGVNYPDGALAAETGEVLFLGAEDDPSDTLKPRLIASGANTDKVHYVRGIRVTENAKRVERAVALDTDLKAIGEALQQNPRIGLVAIDPVTSYFGKTDLNNEQALRKILGPIKALAEDNQVTFVCLGHFNKRSDVNVLHKVGGAVAMTGVARAVWLFMKNPEVDGQFLMLIGKGNLTQKRSGLKYSIVAKTVTTGTAPVIEWQGEENMDAETIAETLKDPKERASAKAEKFLKDFIADGKPELSDVLAARAKEIGIGRTTLFNMKRDQFSNIKAEKRGQIWWWVPVISCSMGNDDEQESQRAMYA